MRRVILLVVFVAIATVGLFLPSRAETWSGPAAYYSSGYGYGSWCNILQQHIAWGNAVSGATCDPNGYFAVYPGIAPGTSLYLEANGVGIWATVGDMVQSGHQAQWLNNWAIELSWSAFTALGLQHNNHVTVSTYGPVTSAPAPVAEVVAEPAADYHPETGHWVIGAFHDYWHANGGLEIFGHPVGGLHYSEHHRMNVQVFERARFEWHDNCQCVLLGRLGAESQ